MPAAASRQGHGSPFPRGTGHRGRIQGAGSGPGQSQGPFLAWRKPAGRLRSKAGPALVLAQVRCRHPGESAGVQAGVSAEVVDPADGVL